jgi:hypothetical protein
VKAEQHRRAGTPRSGWPCWRRADRRRGSHPHHSQYAIGVLSKGWKAKANELVARLRKLLAQFPQLGLVGVPL